MKVNWTLKTHVCFHHNLSSKIIYKPLKKEVLVGFWVSFWARGEFKYWGYEAKRNVNISQIWNNLQSEYQELHHVLRIHHLLSDTDTSRIMIWSKFRAKHILHLRLIHTHTKVKLILSNCCFKDFPSTPSKHNFHHLNEVLQLTEFKNRAKISRKRDQCSRGASPCISYTALSRAGGEGNPFPV